jgi:Zn-dependent protease
VVSKTVVTYIVCAVIAVCFHEAAHGYVANYFGDATAKRAGRLTLNPIRHIDPFGTVLLPLILIIAGLPVFGYAKPVPVNVSRLRKPRNHAFLVSMAGPGLNLAFAGLSIAICRLSGATYEPFSGTIVASSSLTLNIAQAFGLFGLVNVLLAAFNLLPIPPLDGSAVIERLVPQRHIARYYALRQSAMPFLFGFLLMNGLFFHLGNGMLDSLLNAFERLAFKS